MTSTEKRPAVGFWAGFWSFMGALFIARRSKDERHQKAMKNVRWTFTSGFAAVLCWKMFVWGTGFVERVQTSSEARDAAIVRSIAASSERLEDLAGKTGNLASAVTSLQSLAVGRFRCPICPSCPPCPQQSVIVTPGPLGPPAPATQAPAPPKDSSAESWLRRRK